MKKDKVAAYAGTRNYYPHMIPAVISLFENSSVNKVYLLIEDDIFPYKLPNNVITINVSNQGYFNRNGPNYKSKWTYMTMLKIALPKLFPLYDTILSLDVDTIIDNNIDSIWDIDLADNYFGAVKELHRSTDDKPYYNAGVLLINAALLRKTHMCDTLINALNTHKYDFSEQDCINELCADKILYISNDYNVSPFNGVPDVPRIIHFASYSKWDNMVLYQKYARKYEEMFSIG